MNKVSGSLKEIVSVKTANEANEYLNKGWKLMKIFEPKEFILGRYEKKEKELKC